MADVEDMSPAELARHLAAHLRHEARFRGLRYVAKSTETGQHGVSTPDSVQSGPQRSSEPAARAPRARKESHASVKNRVLREQAAAWPAGRKLEYLREKNVGDCRRCALARGRTKLVFGVGSAEADVMFVGEAPGAEEDRSGEPFVGAAGKRLDSWIEAIGLRRADVYIANVLKCRPPGNRDPAPDEIQTCSPFLDAQIRAIQPKVLVALGRFAGALLSGSAGNRRMYQMRETVHEYVEKKSGLRVPLVVTYHPSYVLRSEGGAGRGTDNSGPRKSENDVVLADLKMALKVLGASS